MEAHRDESARRAEAIHSVDSAFGILLIIATLWTTLYVNMLGPREGPVWMGLAFASYSLAVGIGLIGILRQSWMGRFMGWFFAVAILLQQACLFVSYAIGDVLPKLSIMRLIVVFAGFLVSYLFVLLVLVGAYSDRLGSVSWPLSA